PRGARRALEEHVHRWTMVLHGRAVLHAHHVAGAIRLQEHVAVARRYEHHTRHDGVTVARLAHLHGAELVQATGERRGEVLWHVLHDHRAGCVRREGAQEPLYGLGAAGRGADREHL